MNARCDNDAILADTNTSDDSSSSQRQSLCTSKDLISYRSVVLPSPARSISLAGSTGQQCKHLLSLDAARIDHCRAHLSPRILALLLCRKLLDNACWRHQRQTATIQRVTCMRRSTHWRTQIEVQIHAEALSMSRVLNSI